MLAQKLTSPAPNHRKNWILDNQKMELPKFHGSEICGNRSAYLGPARLTLSVYGAREGPAPRAQVSSLLARQCPLPGVSTPLGGVGSLPVPSSPDGITAVDLVKPRVKRPRAAAGRWRPGAGALLAVPAPAAPRPLLGLLGVESPGDPACTRRLPVAVGRWCAEGWLRSPCPPPPLAGLPTGCPPVLQLPPWGGRRRLRCRCGRPTLCRCLAGGGGGGVGGGVRCRALLERVMGGGGGCGESAPRTLLREQGGQ